MNYLITLFFLIIACALGICISLYLEIKSYVISACICTVIFICIELYYNYRLNNAGVFNKMYLNNNGLGISNKYNITSQTFSQNDIKIASQLLTEYQQHKTDPTNTQYIQTINLLSSPGSPNSSTVLTPSVLTEQNNTTQGLVSQVRGVGVFTPYPTLLPLPIQLPSQTIPNQTISDQTIPMLTIPTQPNQIMTSQQATLLSPTTTTYSNNQSPNTQQCHTLLQEQKNPLDGLDPVELTKRLNYIYHATSNPLDVISYSNYKTHADTILDEDKTSLLSNINLSNREHNTKTNKYINNYYPQLTENNIDATDCLNEMNNKNSCFQNQYLFNMSKTDLSGISGISGIASMPSILNKGVNQENANLIIKEDFSLPILFRNAPYGNLDKDLNLQSNEYSDLTANHNAICRGCKLTTCKNNMCALQNNLFM